MKRKEFVYDVKSEVEFSRSEVDQLRKFSAQHYDLKCKMESESGGFLNGMYNMLYDKDSVTYSLSIRQLDRLCKITEPITNLDVEKCGLHFTLRRLLAEAGTEYERVNAGFIERAREEEESFIKGLEEKTRQ